MQEKDRKQRNIEIKITWRLAFYSVFILTVAYLTIKAYINTYVPWLAGVAHLAFFLSYILTVFAIKEGDSK